VTDEVADETRQIGLPTNAQGTPMHRKAVAHSLSGLFANASPWHSIPAFLLPRTSTMISQQIRAKSTSGSNHGSLRNQQTHTGFIDLHIRAFQNSIESGIQQDIEENGEEERKEAVQVFESLGITEGGPPGQIKLCNQITEPEDIKVYAQGQQSERLATFLGGSVQPGKASPPLEDNDIEAMLAGPNVHRGSKPHGGTESAEHREDLAQDDRRSWMEEQGQQHHAAAAAATTRPRSSKEISKFALTRALLFGGRPAVGGEQRRPAGTETQSDGVMAAQRCESASAAQRPAASEAIPKYALARARQFDSGSVTSARTNPEERAQEALRTNKPSDPEESAEGILRIDICSSVERRRPSAWHILPQLQPGPNQKPLTVGERLYVHRWKQMRMQSTSDTHLALELYPGDESSTTGGLANLGEDDLYEAFMLPFHASLPSGEFGLGSGDHEMANPKEDVLDQLEFLERRFGPAFAVLKSLLLKWRQQIWSVAIGLHDDEVAKVGQLTILKETLGRVVQDSSRRRAESRPRLRDDPLWDSVVMDRFTKRDRLANLGLREEAVFVWWHVRKKFRAHMNRIQDENPLNDTRQRLSRFLASSKRSEEERAGRLQRCFRRVDNILKEYADIARNIQRELWLFAMGVDPQQWQLRFVVKHDIKIKMEDVRAAMGYWVNIRDNHLPRPEAGTLGYLKRMRAKLRGKAAMENEVLAKRRLALQRADKRLLGIGSYDSRQTLPQPSDEDLKSNLEATVKALGQYLPHEQYRASQKVTTVERTIDRLTRDIRKWRLDLYTILTGVSFDGPKTHWNITSQFLASAVEVYRSKRRRPLTPSVTGEPASDAMSALKRGIHHVRTGIRRKERQKSRIILRQLQVELAAKGNAICCEELTEMVDTYSRKISFLVKGLQKQTLAETGQLLPRSKCLNSIESDVEAIKQSFLEAGVMFGQLSSFGSIDVPTKTMAKATERNSAISTKQTNEHESISLGISRLRKTSNTQPKSTALLQEAIPEKNLSEDLFELPHEIETKQYTVLPPFVPTSRLLAPLRRILGVDELATNNKLTHLNSTGEARMVSVAAKPDTRRIAIAVGLVRFSNPETYQLVRMAALKKGDVLSISRIAGIQAAKLCPSIIPLCHPIMISSVSVDVVPFEGINGSGISIEGKVECTGPTGVEMEALTAVMGAALTVVDMVKAVDKAASIEDVKVVYKSGGRSGDWVDEEWSSPK
jgi:molybdenum cofactor biosynthesis protein MoaC